MLNNTLGEFQSIKSINWSGTDGSIFEAWCWDEDLRQAGAGADLGLVEQEDADVVLRVAEGHRNRLTSRGRYAPVAERAVHHFHRLIQHQLQSSTVDI